VPYPFAHPAAVLPLARPMGRFAAPSALAIGSVLPDLWYFVPLADRAEEPAARLRCDGDLRWPVEGSGRLRGAAGGAPVEDPP